MDIVVSTPHQETTRKEIKELLKKEAEIITEEYLLFSACLEEAAFFTYNARSITSSMILLAKGRFSSKEDIINQELKIKPFLKERFAIRCKRKGEHDFSSKDIEEELGAKIKAKADLGNPETLILVEIMHDQFLIGVDLAGFKLARRDYRVKTMPVSLHPCIAYAMLREAEWTAKKSLLDPWSKEGTLGIEAALYALSISPFLHEKKKFLFTYLIQLKEWDKRQEEKLNITVMGEKFTYIKNVEVNAKLAGVNKHIQLSRQSLEWLDARFKKKEIDCIVSFLQFARDEDPEKNIKELFHQADYILKGRMVLLSDHPDLIEQYAEHYKFTVKREALEMNGRTLFLFVCQK